MGEGMVFDIGALLRSRGVLESQFREQNEVTPDDRTHLRLARAWRQALINIGSALSPDLLAELSVLIPTPMDDVPSPMELRLLEAELLGWLDGVLASADAAAPG